MLRRNLPNALTLGNLLCGCLAIQQLLSGDPLLAPWLMVASGVLDFFDGMVARALNVLSPVGKDLDSLADVVSFGVLPGFMAFYLIGEASSIDSPQSLDLTNLSPALIAFLIPIFSAFRLAKFNHDTRQTSSFIGMPTPANGFFWAGMFYLIMNDGFEFFSATALSIIALASALWLVSPLPMFSFKFNKNMKIMEWWPQVILLAISIPMLIMYSLSAFASIVFAYALLSLLQSFLIKLRS
ncbi:MAG: CDP-alcohol phosphatidyltransferase family protein [Bacteroidia bacterium]